MWKSPTAMAQPLPGHEQCRHRAAFGKVLAQDQFVQRVELPRHHFEFFGLVARQALRIQVAGDDHVRLVAHVVRRQRQHAQQVQRPRRIAGLFLQLAVGGVQRLLAGIDPALDQAQFVAVQAGGVFAHQQDGVVVEQRDHDHRAVAASVQALVLAAFAVTELQFQPFQPVWPGLVLGDAVDGGQPAGHHVSMIRATDAEGWRARDLEVLWHPCTQMREHPDTLPLIPVAGGEGAWLLGRDGRRYLDAVSSWWTNLFGHAEPRIGAAIAAQARNLEQVILAGFSHAPAVELAERLLAVAPREQGRAPLAKVFYADNGSAGVEVALKMAFHWFRNRGEDRRTKFVALANGYHGETLGALAVGDVPLYRRVYAPLLAECLFAPSPDAWLAEPGQSPEDCARQAAAALDALLHAHAGEVCAFILEPLVQCAGGMRMHHPLYLRLARDLCDAHGVMMIADEIAVGFGRTGTLFACEQAPDGGIQPDLLCLSKGLTGGFLPLAAVLATQSIYDGFLDDSRERAFLHSHSYTGNPLACAAALAA